MDLYTSSVYELRGELRRLMREFLPIPVSVMKRSEVIHHIEAYNLMLKNLKELPVLEGGSGKLPPRPINTIVKNEIYSIPAFPGLRAFGPEKKLSPGIVENGNTQGDNLHTGEKGGIRTQQGKDTGPRK